MSAPPSVSVVVLVDERPEPLDALYQEYSAPLRAAGVPHEFLFLVEPAREPLAAALEPLIAGGAPVRRLLLAHAVPQSALARLAVEQARYDALLLMPAYRRVEAAALPLLAAQVAQGADVALASREARRDPVFNRLQASVFHGLVNRISPRPFADIASGVVAIRRDVLSQLPMHGEFFLFVAVLAAREGFTVLEVSVPQHPADQHMRVFAIGTYIRRLVDLLGLFFLVRFTDRPLRFFGLVGSVLGLAGAAVLLVLFIERLQGVGIGNRPLLLLGLLLLVLGIQSIALGLVAEIIVHLGAPRRRSYRLREPDRRPPSPNP